MPEKMMTLQELSGYILVSEKRIIDLVDEGVIIAYKIAGELLRFRKEQIDAIRTEIESRISEEDRIDSETIKTHLIDGAVIRETVMYGNNSFIDAVSDFFYFNDFYLVSGGIIAALLFIIFKGL